MSDFDAALLSLSRDLLLLVNPQDLSVVAANPAAERHLGYAPGGLVGVTVTELECALSDLFFWDQVRAGERPEAVHAEGMYRTAQGQVLPVEKSVRPLQLGAACYMAVTARLVSEQLATHAALERATSLVQAVLESSPEGLLVTDLDGAIVTSNRPFAELWRLPEPLLAGHDDGRVYRAMARRLADRRQWRAWLAKLGAAREQVTADTLSLRDGRRLACRSRPQMAREQWLGRVYTFTELPPPH